MANKIQLKRGAFASIPVLSDGEFGFSTDAALKKLHIGFDSTNYELILADMFTAQSVMVAVTTDTPTLQTVAEQELIGRLTGGNIGAITIGIADNNMPQVDGTPVDNDFAKWTAAGLEGRTYAETLGDLSGQAAASFAMNSQKLTGVLDPTLAQDAATKAYVDSVSIGLDFKESVRVATIAVLPTCTAAGSGVGKTLTGDAVGILTVDSVNTVLNDRILVKNQVVGSDDGIYKVTTAGTAGVAFILTRAIDFDEDAEVTAGAFMFVTEGTTLGDQGWVLTTNDPITVDTTALVFVQFSSAGTVVVHKNTHDPEDGTDALDTAAAAEISVVVAAGVGSSHSFSRADHIHAINHGITDNHIVTVDGTTNTPVVGDLAMFTALGVEGKTVAEVLDAIDAANTKLSNLEDTVAINKALIPGTTGILDFGATTKSWANMYMAGTSGTPASNYFKLTGASTSGMRTMTFPDESGTVLTDVSTIDGGAFA